MAAATGPLPYKLIPAAGCGQGILEEKAIGQHHLIPAGKDSGLFGLQGRGMGEEKRYGMEGR